MDEFRFIGASLKNLISLTKPQVGFGRCTITRDTRLIFIVYIQTPNRGLGFTFGVNRSQQESGGLVKFDGSSNGLTLSTIISDIIGSWY